MKPLIIYQSKKGNTIKIVEAIATVLEAEVLSVEDAVPENLKDRSLIGFGSGIYWTKIDQKIYESAALLPKVCNAFMFITSGMGFKIMLQLYWYYIKTNFDHLGVNLVGRWDCRGYSVETGAVDRAVIYYVTSHYKSRKLVKCHGINHINT